MKKLFVSFATAVLLLIMTPSQAKEATVGVVTTPVAVKNTESTDVAVLVSRVNEINAMDKSSMSSSEKTALRKELRTIKRDVNRHSSGGVVYVSGGVILLIIILIIIL